MKYPQLTEDYPLTEDQIDQYRRDGFIKLDNVITGETLRAFRAAVVAQLEQEKDTDRMGRKGEERDKNDYGNKLFITQRMNFWQRSESVRQFICAPRLANIAARLMGTPARIWHDNLLFKEPRGINKTPWHQDAPNWPHDDASKQLSTSLWFALQDATIQNGCMSFIPGSHLIGEKPMAELVVDNPKSVYDLAPELEGIKPVTYEIKAGSATFHHGLCYHFAGPNRSDAVREALAILYMPPNTRSNGNKHAVMGNQEFKKGQLLDGENFPILSTIEVNEPVGAA